MSKVDPESIISFYLYSLNEILSSFSLLTRSSEEGYALQLKWEDLSEEVLYESIQKLLYQPRYYMI